MYPAEKLVSKLPLLEFAHDWRIGRGYELTMVCLQWKVRSGTLSACDARSVARSSEEPTGEDLCPLIMRPTAKCNTSFTRTCFWILQPELELNSYSSVILTGLSSQVERVEHRPLLPGLPRRAAVRVVRSRNLASEVLVPKSARNVERLAIPPSDS